MNSKIRFGAFLLAFVMVVSLFAAFPTVATKVVAEDVQYVSQTVTQTAPSVEGLEGTWTVKAPAKVNVGDTFQIEFTYTYNFVALNGHCIGSFSHDFLFDRRYLIIDATGTVPAVGSDAVWDEVSGYNKSGEQATDMSVASMETVNIGAAVFEEHGTPDDNKLVNTVTFKAVAAGICKFEWNYAFATDQIYEYELYFGSDKEPLPASTIAIEVVDPSSESSSEDSSSEAPSSSEESSSAPVVNQYTVTFMVDGAQYGEVQTVNEGAAATKPTDPFKNGYTFTGWDKDFSNVTSDLVVNAQFSINQYTVTFMADGKVVSTQTVNHGAAATTPSAPAKEGHTFSKWDKEYSNVTSDLVVNAIYTINKYTVTFKANGVVIGTAQTVNHGAAASAPNAPAVEGYTFSEWDKEFNNVTSDLVVNAIYTINQYTVTFVVGAQGTTDDQLVWTVDYGTAASAITVPTVVAASAAYEFDDWDQVLPSTITSDITITAKFKTTGSAVNVTFVCDVNGSLKATDAAGATVMVDAGSRIVLAYASGSKAGETFVCPEPIADENYHFVGWYVGDEAYDFNAILEGDVVLTAKFAKNSITIDSFKMDEAGPMGYANAYLYVTLNEGEVPANIKVVTFYQTDDGRTNLTIADLSVSTDAEGNNYIQMGIQPGSYSTFDVYLIDGVVDFSTSDWNVIDIYLGQIIA